MMNQIPDFFPEIKGFEWDEGNSEKNWRRHRVTSVETEQIFLNRPLIVAKSPRGTNGELRHFALGRTDLARHLAVVFTLRGSLLRVISARPMSRRERRTYAQAEATQADSTL